MCLLPSSSLQREFPLQQFWIISSDITLFSLKLTIHNGPSSAPGPHSRTLSVGGGFVLILRNDAPAAVAIGCLIASEAGNKMKNEASSHRSIPVYAGSHAGRSRIWRSLCCLCAVLGSAAANKKWMSDYRTNRVEATVDTEDRFSGSPLSLDLHKSSHKCPQYYLLGQMKCSTTTLFKVR